MDDIKSMLPEEIEHALIEMGQPKYRAKQVFTWLHRDAVRSFDEMTNLSKGLRSGLAERFFIDTPEIQQKQVSSDGTIKYLWRFGDGSMVESVVMSYKHGNTVCISTQVGCRMGCAFCASALGGLERSLTPAEMISEVVCSERDSGLPVSNIVLMGTGEPLDNFENVLRFLILISHPEGKNVGMRHISLSTCGIAEKIDKLGEYNLKLTLSVSLHAPDDETRMRLMPVNRATGVDDLLSACNRYFRKTGRRISYEYALIDGVNDSVRQAELLSDKLAGTGSHLNLILLNDVTERELCASAPDRVRAFTEVLENKGVNYTFRRRLGGDIDASCGQLRWKQTRPCAPLQGD